MSPDPPVGDQQGEVEHRQDELLEAEFTGNDDHTGQAILSPDPEAPPVGRDELFEADFPGDDDPEGDDFDEGIYIRE